MRFFAKLQLSLLTPLHFIAVKYQAPEGTPRFFVFDIFTHRGVNNNSAGPKVVKTLLLLQSLDK